jgi:hypothetical protein
MKSHISGHVVKKANVIEYSNGAAKLDIAAETLGGSSRLKRMRKLVDVLEANKLY